MFSRRNLAAALALLAPLFMASTGLADTQMAHPLGFPEPTGEIAETVTGIYNFIFYICAVILVIVEVGLLYCIWRFRRAKNPNPAKFTHNTFIEIVWTVIPAIICVVIAWKSFEAMKLIRTMPQDGVDVEVIAYQFGWDFDYPESKIGAPEAESTHAELSSAGVDRYVKTMVVPVNTNVKLHITSKDVIHAYFVPKLGIKIDAIPGRINYQWFNSPKVGDYLGQCAELCGSAHGEMFFNVKVVTKPEYVEWVNRQRAEEGLDPVAMIQ